MEKEGNNQWEKERWGKRQTGVLWSLKGSKSFMVFRRFYGVSRKGYHKLLSKNFKKKTMVASGSTFGFIFFIFAYIYNTLLRSYLRQGRERPKGICWKYGRIKHATSSCTNLLRVHKATRT